MEIKTSREIKRRRSDLRGWGVMQTQTMNGAGREMAYLHAAQDLRALGKVSYDTQLSQVARKHGLDPRDLGRFAAGYALPPAPEKDAFGSFGEMLQAVHRAGMPNTPKDLIDRRLKAAASGLNESVSSDGGWLISQDRTIDIRDRVYATGELLNRVTRLPLGPGKNGTKLLLVDDTSRVDGERHGGVRSYWLAEAGEKTPSRPKFRGDMTLKLNKVAAMIYATDELLEDAPMLEAWINRVLPDELRLRGEQAILNGNGAGQPLGLLNSDVVIEVTPVPGQGATFDFENVLAMWERLAISSRANAVWFVSQSVERYLYTMTMAVGLGGVLIFQPADVMRGQLYPTLMGRPVIPIEYAQQVGTLGDVILADLSSYLWIDKGDVKGASSIHVRFVYDETAFRFVWRVDGAPEWNAPLTPMNGGPTVGPIVVLGTR